MKSSQILQRLQALQIQSRKDSFRLPPDQKAEYSELLRQRRDLVLYWTGMGHRASTPTP